MTETEAKMAYDAKPKIIIESQSFGMILCSAVRYALGRMTYIVPSTTEYITPLIPYLSTNILQIMNKDITDAEKDDCLGMDCDAKVWIAFRNEVQREIAFRKD